jgi:hypothetical protein
VDDQTREMFDIAVSRDDADHRWLNAARVAVGRAGGRDWWWVLNLTRRCLQGWPYINGKLLLSGVHADRIHFADWLDAAYMLLLTGQDEKGALKLDTELNTKPVGVPIRQTPAQIRAAAAAFAAD